MVVVREWGVMMVGVVDCWLFLREAYLLLLAPDLAGAEGYTRISYRSILVRMRLLMRHLVVRGRCLVDRYIQNVDIEPGRHCKIQGAKRWGGSLCSY